VGPFGVGIPLDGVGNPFEDDDPVGPLDVGVDPFDG